MRGGFPEEDSVTPIIAFGACQQRGAVACPSGKLFSSSQRGYNWLRKQNCSSANSKYDAQRPASLSDRKVASFETVPGEAFFCSLRKSPG